MKEFGYVGDNKRKLAIFGCGYEGERLYYQLEQHGIEIEYVIDNYKTGFFHGIKINNPKSLIMRMNEMMILVSSEKYYNEIKEQLRTYGLKEFDNFIIGKAFRKKMAVINANCYGTVIKDFLNSNDAFTKVYYIYNTRPIHIEPEKGLEEESIRKCDLFIHQDIRDENPYGYCYSDTYTGSLLKKDCINITFPNLVGMGNAFFPQGDVDIERSERVDMPVGLFPYGDINVKRMAENGYSEEKIIESVMSGNTYSENYVKENFKRIIKKFIERERYWDIKIIDFILDRYKDEKVFFDINHPTNLVLEHIAQEILHFLGLQKTPLESKADISCYEMPIYPEVCAALGLTYGDGSALIRKDSPWKLVKNMDMEEYIREYIFWCNLCKC